MQDFDVVKEVAIEQFVARYKNSEIPIDNSKLVAESPMYYYCRHCKTLTEILVEDHIFPPNTQCSQCKGLDYYNWLNEAKSRV